MKGINNMERNERERGEKRRAMKMKAIGKEGEVEGREGWIDEGKREGEK